MFPFPIPWKLIGIALAAIALVWLIHHSIVSYGDGRYGEGASETKVLWTAQTIKEAEQANKLVEEAKAEAQVSREKAATERKAREDEQRSYQESRQNERAGLIHDLESRYRKALVEDQSCAAWSKQLVSCPVR